MKTAKATLALALVAFSAFAAPHARAWYTEICSNGKTWQGIHGTVQWSLVGNKTAEWWDIAIDAVDRWNGIKGVTDRFTGISSGPATPSYSTYSGTWQLVQWPHGTWPLSGNESGVSDIIFYNCSDGGGVRGARVFIDSSVREASSDEMQQDDQRSVLIHELGHVLGMYHDDNRMSVMHTFTPVPRVGIGRGAPFTSLSSVGGATYWATDADFMEHFFPSSSAGLPDPAASPWKWNGSHSAMNYPNFVTIERCPGETISVDYTIANLGLEEFSATVLLVLSQNDPITTNDMVVKTTTSSRSATSYNEYTKTFTMPTPLGTGTFDIGVIVDPWDDITDDTESNNAALTGLRVRVPGECF